MTHKLFSEVTELKYTPRKELFLSQSTFCFLKVQGQDVISLLLSFLKKIQSKESSPEHPQRYSIIFAFMLSSFCAHSVLFLELKHHCQTPRLTQGLSLIIFPLKRAKHVVALPLHQLPMGPSL